MTCCQSIRLPTFAGNIPNVIGERKPLPSYPPACPPVRLLTCSAYHISPILLLFYAEVNPGVPRQVSNRSDLSLCGRNAGAEEWLLVVRDGKDNNCASTTITFAIAIFSSSSLHCLNPTGSAGSDQLSTKDYELARQCGTVPRCLERDVPRILSLFLSPSHPSPHNPVFLVRITYILLVDISVRIRKVLFAPKPCDFTVLGDTAANAYNNSSRCRRCLVVSVVNEAKNHDRILRPHISSVMYYCDKYYNFSSHCRAFSSRFRSCLAKYYFLNLALNAITATVDCGLMRGVKSFLKKGLLNDELSDSSKGHSCLHMSASAHPFHLLSLEKLTLLYQIFFHRKESTPISLNRPIVVVSWDG
ncbi:hypothetical protein X798_03745 [Onchocerca flexuosa]|uniref:Uncharacterized protein n=1 Tax=Onchocerca flexuosa TaxID=387005 RepID=A0A238BV25_9BILA|nr:hypothetical protein X798_03745 [Onchocerca flexuosa]